jgi:hypothetical protein
MLKPLCPAPTVTGKDACERYRARLDAIRASVQGRLLHRQDDEVDDAFFEAITGGKKERGDSLHLW